VKFQVVYRTEEGTAEIHSMACRDWEDTDGSMVVDAPHTWGAALEAWGHDTEPELCAVQFTYFFPCLAERKATPRRNLPFDPEGTPAEIIEACYGKLIKWKNGISGNVEMARLYPEGPHDSKRRGIVTYPHKYTEVTYGPNGEGMLNFLDVGGGFRAVRLDAIVSVGRR
jgi:hypothetical protein